MIHATTTQAQRARRVRRAARAPHRTPHLHARRPALLAGLAAAALLTGLAPAAQAQPAVDIHIAAGPLDAALLALAAQTHEQLLFGPEVTAGRTAPALDGTLTPEAALARLLAGTDIEVRRAGPGVLVLRPRGAPEPPAPARAPAPAGPARPFGADPAGAPAPGPAQPVTSAGAAAAPTTVAEVEVTGSHIRGAKTASPLVTLSRADLERTGQSTLAAALRSLPEVFKGGAADVTLANGADPQGTNSVFATGINLRGLGANATLVLVNGRRIAGTGAFGDFADVSAIPTAAVERVEVLLDGASALYGSDAVGGVVNIILRRDYDGAEVRLEGGTATRGDPAEGQASLTLGRRWTGGGALLAWSAETRSALAGADRAFTATTDLRALGGTDHRSTSAFPGNILIATPTGLQPLYAIPGGQDGVGLTPGQLLPGVVNRSNQRTGADVLPRQTTQAVYLSADQALTDRLQVSADARYSHRAYRLQIAIPTANLTVTRANPFFVSPTGASSEVIAYNFLGDLPAPVQAGSAETLTTTLGGKLSLAGDWQASGYAAFGQEVDRTDNTGLVHSGFLNEALGTTPDNPATSFSPATSGYFNPFSGIPGSNSAAITRFIGSGAVSTYTRNRVVSADLQADGTAWTLPGGPLKVAFGLQARREALVRNGLNFVSGPTPTPAAASDVARTVTAAFAELQVPLVGAANARPGLARLELSLAGRVEHYSGVGTTSNPKLGLLWSPGAGLTARATYGTSFRAPELRELTDPAIYAPTLLPLAGSSVRTLVLTGGNPELKPETATSWTAGVDWRPPAWPGLDLSLTWFDTRFKNRINRPVAANLVGALSDPTLARFVTRISPTTNPADLATISALLQSPALSTLSGVFPPTAYGAIVDERFVNTATLQVQGLDLEAKYLTQLGSDRLALGLDATDLLTYRQQITPTAASVSLLNLVNNPLRLQGRATADWTHGRLTTGLALNYADAYRDTLGHRIGRTATVDLQLRLDPPEQGMFKGVTVLFNVRNLFDQAPPFYDNPLGVGFDAGNGDPIGRFVALTLTRSW